MLIRIDGFRGETPRVHPRLLPDGHAQAAISTRMDDGTLAPLNRPRLVHSFETPVRTVYRYGSQWLGFFSDTAICPGPVAASRLYYTGDGAPKVRSGTTVYPLALPPPTAAPGVSLSGPHDADTEQSVVYAFTHVTSMDEESAPSPISAEVLWSRAETAELTFPAVPEGRGIDRRRIYRSQTAISGVTELYFVAEIPAATTTFAHDIETHPLGEPLPSLDYDPAPDDLAGLTAMPNGMMAAFRGRELCFSEPYRPHAWPEKYRLTVDFDIVALSAFGSTLAVLTTGTPYLAQGSHPESVALEKMEAGLPCVSAAGVVDMGHSAIYPSHDGLVQMTAAGAQMISRPLFARTDWHDLRPETMFAANFDGRYCFRYIANTQMILGGAGADADLSDAPLYTGGTAFTTGDAPVYTGGNSLTPAQGSSLGIIDTTGESPFFVRTEPTATMTPTGLHFSPETGKLYIISNGLEVYEFDAITAGRATMTWRSKVYDLPSPVNFGAMLIESDDTPGVGAALATRIYADGKKVHETNAFGAPTRLPGGFLARRWEIEVTGTAHVRSIRIAGDMTELVEG